MTRKKYDTDTYYQKMEADLLSSSDEEDTEEYKLTDGEVYDIICYYYDDVFWNIDWVQSWLDPTTIENIIFKECTYDTYVNCSSLMNNQYEEYTCMRMRNMIHHMCDSLLLKPTPLMVEHILYDMLSVRNRYETVVPRSKFHWSRKWCKILQKSENMY